MNQKQMGYIEITKAVLESFWLNNREVVPLEIYPPTLFSINKVFVLF